MNIGVLKEIKVDENRVAMTPFFVKDLVEQGHKIYVESKAGEQASFSDEDYKETGAIISQKQDILEKCTLLLKVKCPTKSEFKDYDSRHVIFTYFHLDENIPKSRIQDLIKTGALGIAYEWVEDDNGKHPLLEPMSRITGYLFYQRSIEMCTQYKGILTRRVRELGNIGASILIIGVGTIGLGVLECAIADGLEIFVVDKNKDTLINKIDSLKYSNFDPSRLHIIPFNNENPFETKREITELMPKLDIIICSAVRRADLPKDRIEYLIDRNMIKKMSPNSIVCDATACDQDFIETCISSEKLDYFKKIDNVIHYSPDHIPSLTGKTSTELLAKSTYNYVSTMANYGVQEAICMNSSLRRGVVFYKGRITHKYTARKKGFEYTDIMELFRSNETP